jgi:hypothetical protein
MSDHAAVLALLQSLLCHMLRGNDDVCLLLCSAGDAACVDQFMAPELYEEKYDEKVDVYSFGMVSGAG